MKRQYEMDVEEDLTKKMRSTTLKDEVDLLDLIERFSDNNLLHDSEEEVNILESSINGKYDKNKVKDILDNAYKRYKRYIQSVNFKITGHSYIEDAMIKFMDMEWMPDTGLGYMMMKKIDKTILTEVQKSVIQ